MIKVLYGFEPIGSRIAGLGEGIRLILPYALTRHATYITLILEYITQQFKNVQLVKNYNNISSSPSLLVFIKDCFSLLCDSVSFSFTLC